MSSHDVARAQDWSKDLVRWEAGGWGDAGNAMRRVAMRTGIPFAKLWALRYRPPKAIASHVLRRIEAAHAAERERQLRKLAYEATLTAQVAGSAHPAVAAARAALGAAGLGADPAAAGVGDPALEPAAGPAAADRARDAGRAVTTGGWAA